MSRRQRTGHYETGGFWLRTDDSRQRLVKERSKGTVIRLFSVVYFCFIRSVNSNKIFLIYKIINL